MANTVIQLKFSTATATPTTLNVAEPAYSYVSNTLFIGSPAGTGSIAIGGKFYLDQQQIIFNTANAAFTAANTGSAAAAAFNQANAAFIAANSAGAYANSAFLAANIADAKAVTAGSYANSAFIVANNSLLIDVTQNNSITAAFTAANSAGVYANGAFAAANTAQAGATSAGIYANGAFAAANTAQNSATAAFIRANNSISANAGGTITGSLVVTGNLTVQGNTTFVDTEILSVEDSLIKLANNNTADSLDIGFYGQYNSTGTKFAGLARNAATDNFFLFKGLTADPAGNTLASGSVTAANAATLIANVSAYSVTIGGQNIQTYTNNAYNTANAAFIVANNSLLIDTTQNNSIAAAFTAANSAGSYANSAFARANNSLDRTTGGSITGNINVSGNVYAGNIIANSAFVSSGGGSRLQLSDIGIASIQVGATEFKFQASGIESSPGIFGGAFGGNKLSLNNETILVSNRFDLVKIQTGEDGTVKNEFSFANNAFIAPGEITAGSVVAGGINVVPTLASSFNTANAAFDKANTDFTGISITAAHYGTASFVPAFRVEANGRISSANSTAIAIDASAITSGTLGVTRGGTGAATFTTNGVLLGQGTSALTTASSSTEGHVLTINASGVPTFAHLQGGTF